MVIEKVLHFYKKGLNNWDLVFKYMKVSLLYFFILNLVLLGSLFYCLANKSFDFNLFALVFWAITLFSSMYFFISRPVKKVIKSKFGISMTAKVFAPFSTSEWRTFRLAVLKTFLKQNDIQNKLTTDELNRIITKKAETQEGSYTPLISTGIILSLFVPVWSAANTRFFKSINDFNIGLATVMFAFFVIVIISMIIMYVKYFSNEFSFYHQEKARINSLINSLNIISFEMLLEENDSSRKSHVFQENIIEKVIEDYHIKISNSNKNQLNAIGFDTKNIKWFKLLYSPKKH